MKYDTLEYNTDWYTKRQCVTEMMDFLKERGGKLTEYDDKLVWQLVERVIVNEEKLMVAFKSRLGIEK